MDLTDKSLSLYLRLMLAAEPRGLPNLAIARSLINEVLVALTKAQTELDKLRDQIKNYDLDVDRAYVNGYKQASREYESVIGVSTKNRIWLN